MTLTYTINWDDNDPTGREIHYTDIALDRVPKQEMIGIGSNVLFRNFGLTIAIKITQGHGESFENAFESWLYPLREEWVRHEPIVGLRVGGGVKRLLSFPPLRPIF